MKDFILRIIIVVVIAYCLCTICYLYLSDDTKDKTTDYDDRRVVEDVTIDPNEEYELSVRRWDEKEDNYIIGTIKGYQGDVKGINYWTKYIEDCTKTLEDFAKENSDCVMDIDYINLYGKYPAKVFYNDNAFYVICSVDDKTIMVNSMYSTICPEGGEIKMPMLAEIYFFDDEMSAENSLMKKEVSSFFDTYTFEQNKEFYQFMDDDFYSIDEKNHIITVKGKSFVDGNNVDNGYIENALILNFENRTITTTDYHEKTIIYKCE